MLRFIKLGDHEAAASLVKLHDAEKVYLGRHTIQKVQELLNVMSTHPDTALDLAKLEYPDRDMELIQRTIGEVGDPVAIYDFARDMPDADIDYLWGQIQKTNNQRFIHRFRKMMEEMEDNKQDNKQGEEK